MAGQHKAKEHGLQMVCCYLCAVYHWLAMAAVAKATFNDDIHTGSAKDQGYAFCS